MGISEIVEIGNSTARDLWSGGGVDYFVYVWDEAHEGRYYYPPQYLEKDSKYPSDGAWIRLYRGDVYRVRDCGLPDGGQSAGKARTRVIFKAGDSERISQGDPHRGLRINRVSLGGGNDAILFRDNATGAEISRIAIPSVLDQTLSLNIDANGAWWKHVSATEKRAGVAGSSESDRETDRQLAAVMGEAFEAGAKAFLEAMHQGA